MSSPDMLEAVRAVLRANQDAPDLTPVRGNGPFALSFPQERLWQMRNIAPESTAYNLSWAFRLRGPLNVPALNTSLNELVRRHASLRTVFRLEDGRAVQYIRDFQEQHLPLMDLRSVPFAEQEARVRALIEKEAGRVFDLSKGPLHGALIAQLSENDYALLYTAHHIIFDYWSFSVFFRELGRFYDTFAQGIKPSLPETRLRYVDFALNQRNQLLQDNELEGHLHYWREHLQTRGQRPGPAPFGGGRARARFAVLEPSLADELREFAHTRSVTLYTVLLTGWVMALAEHDDFRSGESIYVYSPAANRNRRELEDLIGYFINLLVLRTSLHGEPAPGDLLNRVHQAVTGGYAHQELPVQFLNRIPGVRPPHTRVMFTFLNTPRSRLELRNVSVEEMEPGLGRAEFQLFPYMFVSPRGLECILRYDSTTVSDDFADGLLVRYRECLRDLLNSPITRRPAHGRESPDEFAPEIREAAANLRASLTDDLHGGRGEAAAEQESPEALASLVAATLGVDEIDAELPLHHYGLNSLAALHIRNSIRSQWAAEISLPDILRGITLNELGQAVAGARRSLAINSTEIIATEKPSDDRLSAGRKALWFLHERSPNSLAYNIAQGMRLKKAAAPPDIFRAVELLVQRHAALRTTYYFQNNTPQAHTHEFLDFERHEIQASDEPLLEHIKSLRDKPFDLKNGPVLRVGIVTRGPGEQYILLFLHHISLDFQSLKLITHEWYSLLQSVVQRTDLPAQTTHAEGAFTDFQAELISGAQGAAQWNYWREQLNELPLLNLPTDFPRPPIQLFRGSTLAFEIPSDYVCEVKQVVRERELTSYMVYLTAFSLLLARYSDQREIVLGGLASGRTRSEWAQAVGYFVNALVLRIDPGESPRVVDVFERVRETVSRALEHQDLPFPLIVERLAPERDLSRTPLFQVLFNMIRMDSENEDWSPVYVPQQEGQFDITFEVHEYSDRVNVMLKYSQDLYETTTIERMRDHFLNLLGGVLRQPEAPALNLPLMHASERSRILARGIPATRSVEHVPAYRRFENMAGRNPQAPALRFAHESQSYGELNLRAENYRRALSAHEIGPEAIVAIALTRGPEMIAALLGIHKSGAAYLPLDPNYPLERLEFMLSDSGAVALIIEGDSPLLPELSRTSSVYLLHPRDIQSDSHGKNINEGTQTSAVETPSRLSHVIYTSGSTGRPKGVAIEQGSLSALMDWALEYYTRDELAGVLAATSLCFDLSVFEILVPLCAGGCVIIATNALELREHPAREEITLLNTVPSAAAALLRDDALPGSLRTINLAGEPLTGELVDRLYAREGIRKVYDLYGPSEDTTYSTVALREREGPEVIGRAVTGGGTYILDRHMNPLPPGIPGELYLSGAGLARGYLGRPELTREKFIPNPFAADTRLYRTGDLALYTETGDIRFLGRVDQQLKLRGYRIEPGEVRAVLESHPHVREAFVLKRVGDAFLTAYVESEKQESEFRTHINKQLPEYMRPRFIVVMAELPRTPNGKVDAMALPAPIINRAPGKPVTNMEKSIAGLWCEALKLEHVGPLENFFDLGGHSLLVLQIRARIKEKHGLELSITQLFQFNTVKALARHLEEQLHGPTAAPTGKTPSAPLNDNRAKIRQKRRALRNQ